MLKCTEKYQDSLGKGGLNIFRLVSKRCKRVVESCATKLSNLVQKDGPESINFPDRCTGVIEIQCLSHNLKRLEGCPSGLACLWLGEARNLSDISPLVRCSMMQIFRTINSSISDISVVASMPLLTDFHCLKLGPGGGLGRLSIKDLTPLSFCPLLKHLRLTCNREIKDLSPLSACTALEVLHIAILPLVTNLAPLASLGNLYELDCRLVHPQTSLLPLISCTALKNLSCDEDHADDVEELRRRRPDMSIQART